MAGEHVVDDDGHVVDVHVLIAIYISTDCAAVFGSQHFGNNRGNVIDVHEAIVIDISRRCFCKRGYVDSAFGVIKWNTLLIKG